MSFLNKFEKFINKNKCTICEELKTYATNLELIINKLPDGVVAIDENLKILIVNPFAKEILGLEKDYLNKNIYELIKDESICNLIEKTIHENYLFSEEFSLNNHAKKVLKITTIPIKFNNNTKGAILLIQDITEIKNLQKIGDEFVSNVTHELKTPLTSIRGFIETLKNGALNDPEVAYKFLDIIDIEADRLSLLINDILTLSEIETMKQDIDITVVLLHEVVNDVLNILQSQADKKNITINTDIEPGLKIQANKNRIMQLILNLVDNSIKYSPEGSWVLIKAYCSGPKTIISVKDSGIEIPPEHLSRIFERFYRVDKGRSRSLGGTGLGLSIVKHIVNLYNGEISVQSEPGKGTEFTITLPC